MSASERLLAFYGNDLLTRSGTLASVKSFGSQSSAAPSAISGTGVDNPPSARSRPGENDVVIDPYTLDSSDFDSDSTSNGDNERRPYTSDAEGDEEDDEDTEWTSATDYGTDSENFGGVSSTAVPGRLRRSRASSIAASVKSRVSRASRTSHSSGLASNLIDHRGIKRDSARSVKSRASNQGASRAVSGDLASFRSRASNIGGPPGSRGRHSISRLSSVAGAAGGRMASRVNSVVRRVPARRPGSGGGASAALLVSRAASGTGTALVGATAAAVAAAAAAAAACKSPTAGSAALTGMSMGTSSKGTVNDSTGVVGSLGAEPAHARNDRLSGRYVRRRLLRRRGWEFELKPGEVDYTLGRPLPNVLTRPQPTINSEDEESSSNDAEGDGDDEGSIPAGGGLPPPGPVLEAIKTYAHELAPEVLWAERLRTAKRIARSTGQMVTVRGRMDRRMRRDLARRIQKWDNREWFASRKRTPPAPPLHPAVARVIEHWFSLVDDDGSGTLDHGELLAALRASKVPVSPDNINEMIDLMDLDGDGVINWKEFETFFMYEFAAGKNLLSGEYVLPSGVALPFGAMIAKLKRSKLMGDLIQGGVARAKWSQVADNPLALEDELGMMAAVEMAMEEMKNPALGRRRVRAAKALARLPPHLRTKSLCRHLERHPEIADKLLRAPSIAPLLLNTMKRSASTSSAVMKRLASQNSQGSATSSGAPPSMSSLSTAGGGAGGSGGGRAGNVDLNVAAALAAGLEWPVNGANFYNRRAKMVLRAACQRPAEALLRSQAGAKASFARPSIAQEAVGAIQGGPDGGDAAAAAADVARRASSCRHGVAAATSAGAAASGSAIAANGGDGGVSGRGASAAARAAAFAAKGRGSSKMLGSLRGNERMRSGRSRRRNSNCSSESDSESDSFGRGRARSDSSEEVLPWLVNAKQREEEERQQLRQQLLARAGGHDGGATSGGSADGDNDGDGGGRPDNEDEAEQWVSPMLRKFLKQQQQLNQRRRKSLLEPAPMPPALTPAIATGSAATTTSAAAGAAIDSTVEQFDSDGLGDEDTAIAASTVAAATSLRSRCSSSTALARAVLERSLRERPTSGRVSPVDANYATEGSFGPQGDAAAAAVASDVIPSSGTAEGVGRQPPLPPPPLDTDLSSGGAPLETPTSTGTSLTAPWSVSPAGGAVSSDSKPRKPRRRMRFEDEQPTGQDPEGPSEAESAPPGLLSETSAGGFSEPSPSGPAAVTFAMAFSRRLSSGGEDGRNTPPPRPLLHGSTHSTQSILAVGQEESGTNAGAGANGANSLQNSFEAAAVGDASGRPSSRQVESPAPAQRSPSAVAVDAANSPAQRVSGALLGDDSPRGSMTLPVRGGARGGLNRTRLSLLGNVEFYGVDSATTAPPSLRPVSVTDDPSRRISYSAYGTYSMDEGVGDGGTACGYIDALDAEEAREMMAAITLDLRKEETLYDIHKGHQIERPSTGHFRAALAKLRTVAPSLVQMHCLPPHPEFSGHSSPPSALQQRPTSPIAVQSFLTSRTAAVHTTTAGALLPAATAAALMTRSALGTSGGGSLVPEPSGGSQHVSPVSTGSYPRKASKQAVAHSRSLLVAGFAPGSSQISAQSSSAVIASPPGVPQLHSSETLRHSAAAEMTYSHVPAPPVEPAPVNRAPDSGILAAAIATARSGSRCKSRPPSRCRSPIFTGSGSRPLSRAGSPRRPASGCSDPRSPSPHLIVQVAAAAAAADRLYSITPGPNVAVPAAPTLLAQLPEAWDAHVAAILQRHTAAELAAVQRVVQSGRIGGAIPYNPASPVRDVSSAGQKRGEGLLGPPSDGGGARVSPSLSPPLTLTTSSKAGALATVAMNSTVPWRAVRSFTVPGAIPGATDLSGSGVVSQQPKRSLSNLGSSSSAETQQNPNRAALHLNELFGAPGSGLPDFVPFPGTMPRLQSRYAPKRPQPTDGPALLTLTPDAARPNDDAADAEGHLVMHESDGGGASSKVKSHGGGNTAEGLSPPDKDDVSGAKLLSHGNDGVRHVKHNARMSCEESDGGMGYCGSRNDSDGDEDEAVKTAPSFGRSQGATAGGGEEVGTGPKRFSDRVPLGRGGSVSEPETVQAAEDRSTVAAAAAIAAKDPAGAHAVDLPDASTEMTMRQPFYHATEQEPVGGAATIAAVAIGVDADALIGAGRDPHATLSYEVLGSMVEAPSGLTVQLNLDEKLLAMDGGVHKRVTEPPVKDRLGFRSAGDNAPDRTEVDAWMSKAEEEAGTRAGPALCLLEGPGEEEAQPPRCITPMTDGSESPSRTPTTDFGDGVYTGSSSHNASLLGTEGTHRCATALAGQDLGEGSQGEGREECSQQSTEVGMPAVPLSKTGIATTLYSDYNKPLTPMLARMERAAVQQPLAAPAVPPRYGPDPKGASELPQPLLHKSPTCRTQAAALNPYSGLSSGAALPSGYVLPTPSRLKVGLATGNLSQAPSAQQLSYHQQQHTQNPQQLQSQSQQHHQQQSQQQATQGPVLAKTLGMPVVVSPKVLNDLSVVVGGLQTGDLSGVVAVGRSVGGAVGMAAAAPDGSSSGGGSATWTPAHAAGLPEPSCSSRRRMKSLQSMRGQQQISNSRNGIGNGACGGGADGCLPHHQAQPSGQRAAPGVLKAETPSYMYTSTAAAGPARAIQSGRTGALASTGHLVHTFPVQQVLHPLHPTYDSITPSASATADGAVGSSTSGGSGCGRSSAALSPPSLQLPPLPYSGPPSGRSTASPAATHHPSVDPHTEGGAGGSANATASVSFGSAWRESPTYAIRRFTAVSESLPALAPRGLSHEGTMPVRTTSSNFVPGPWPLGMPRRAYSSAHSAVLSGNVCAMLTPSPRQLTTLSLQKAAWSNEYAPAATAAAAGGLAEPTASGSGAEPALHVPAAEAYMAEPPAAAAFTPAATASTPLAAPVMSALRDLPDIVTLLLREPSAPIRSGPTRIRKIDY